MRSERWKIRIYKRKCWGNSRQNYIPEVIRKQQWKAFRAEADQNTGGTEGTVKVQSLICFSSRVLASLWMFSSLQLLDTKSVEFSWSSLNSVETGYNHLWVLYVVMIVWLMQYISCFTSSQWAHPSTFIIISFYFYHKTRLSASEHKAML